MFGNSNLLPKVALDGRELKVETARCSAMPVNIRWPGHQRELDQTEICTFVRFDLSKPVALTVTAPADFTKAVIRPLSKQVAFARSGNTLSFTLKEPGAYSVEFDGRHHNLHVFADVSGDYSAIDRTAANVRYFGPGSHDVGPIELKTDETLFIDEGATVYGRVFARDADHIRIVGRGILDCSKVKEVPVDIDPALAAEQRKKGWAITNVKRFDAIRLDYCDDVKVEGITIRDAPLYTIRPICSRGFTVENVKIIGNWRYNSDGIDMHNCRHVRIRNCFLRTFDDSICVKGFDYRMNEADMLHDGEMHDVFDDVLVEKCTLWTDWGLALEIGAETRAREISNVLFRDCDVIWHHASAMNVQHCDQALVHDIVYDGIRVEYDDDMPYTGYLEHAAQWDSSKRGRLADVLSARIAYIPEYSKPDCRGSMRDITFRNIDIFSSRLPGASFAGFDDRHQIRGIHIENVRLNGKDVTEMFRAKTSLNKFASWETVSPVVQTAAPGDDSSAVVRAPARLGGERQQSCRPPCVSCRMADPLEWLYPDSNVAKVVPFSATEIPANGVAEANILFNGLEKGKPVVFSADIAGAEWFQLVDVPVEVNTGTDGAVERACETNRFVSRDAPFRVFDAMKPLTGSSFVPDAPTAALRVRLRSFDGKTGTVPVRLSFSQGAFSVSETLRVNVHAATVPPVGKDSFRYTNWMNYDSMAACHGLKPWSPEHREMIRKYVRLAVYGRQNMAMVPYFGWNEKGVQDFVTLLTEEGIWYIEGAHLAGFSTHKWGAPAFVTRGSTNLTTSLKGAAELAQRAAFVSDLVRKNGWAERWYQHVADEPSVHNLAEYRQTCGIVRKYMPGIRLTDAVESFEVAGALDAYCPKNKYYEENRAQFEALRTQPSDEIWCYTCMFPGGPWMNRLLDNELIRPVLLPWGCTLFSLNGYLHWGYNQFTPKNDPLRVSFTYNEHMSSRLPPGDRNIVYAGTDGPWPSVRLEAMRQGFEDLELLRLLAKRDKSAADALTKRLVRGFADYVTDTKTYWSVRKNLLETVVR